MIKWHISWPGRTREHARRRGVALVAFGIDTTISPMPGEYSGMRCEALKPIDRKLAENLQHFMMLILEGKHPLEAFDSTDWEVQYADTTVKFPGLDEGVLSNPLQFLQAHRDACGEGATDG